MIVVSDAGPLIYLGSVGQLALLQALFGRIVAHGRYGVRLSVPTQAGWGTTRGRAEGIRRQYVRSFSFGRLAGLLRAVGGFGASRHRPWH